MSATASRNRLSLKGIFLGRCPRCGDGRIFLPGLKGFLGLMQSQCEVCGLRFLREAGYFLGAMYVSYGLGVFTVLPVAVFLAVVLEWSIAAVTAVAILQTILSVPLFLRFSRILWLHVDFAFDPV